MIAEAASHRTSPLAGFVLEKLADDGNLVLSRAMGDDEEQPAFLVLASADSTPTAESLARLHHFYALRAELDPSWATTPRDLVQQDGRPVLRLEDPGGNGRDATLLSRA